MSESSLCNLIHVKTCVKFTSRFRNTIIRTTFSLYGINLHSVFLTDSENILMLSFVFHFFIIISLCFSCHQEWSFNACFSIKNQQNDAYFTVERIPLWFRLNCNFLPFYTPPLTLYCSFSSNLPLKRNILWIISCCRRKKKSRSEL